MSTDLLISFVGLLLIFLTAYDFFDTTLSSNGSGFITHRVSHGIWQLLLRISQARDSPHILKRAGISVILSLIALWLGLLWLGLFLLLVGDSDSVVTSSKSIPATVPDKLYYSGYVLSTMGNGGFKPGSSLWQFITSVFSFAGFIFITTAMTYVISVASAVIDKRSLSLFIANLGDSPQQILINAWDGERLLGLTSVAIELQQMINRHVQNHMAYSTLHFFHSGYPQNAIAINIARLDEALSIALVLFDPVLKKDQQQLRPLRNALSVYLDTLEQTFVGSAQNVEALPDLSSLNDQRIGVLTKPATIEKKLAEFRKRRKLLTGFLHSSGWDWDDVYK